MATKLRGQGPKTFISYGFGNTLAPRIAEYLTAEGFQVTLIVDTMLLGEPSLSAALDRHIGAAEVVVPVLDRKANQSIWVQKEVETAIGHGRIVLPVVQDPETLPDRVRDIPYLSEHNYQLLVPTALKRFALLPLDPERPYLFRDDNLSEYLFGGREVSRVILDSDDFTGQLLDRLPEVIDRLTEAPPPLRATVERQARSALSQLIRAMDRAQPALPQFRGCVNEALARWGEQRLPRIVAAWQRLARLLVGHGLVAAADTFWPERYSEFWGTATRGMNESHLAARPSDRTCYWARDHETHWALTHRGNEAVDGWSEVVFEAPNRPHFRGYFPTTTDVTDMLAWQAKPSKYLDNFLWAEIGLPQVVNDAVAYPGDAIDNSWIETTVWTLADFMQSGRP